MRGLFSFPLLVQAIQGEHLSAENSACCTASSEADSPRLISCSVSSYESHVCQCDSARPRPLCHSNRSFAACISITHSPRDGLLLPLLMSTYGNAVPGKSSSLGKAFPSGGNSTFDVPKGFTIGVLWHCFSFLFFLATSLWNGRLFFPHFANGGIKVECLALGAKLE